jgi:hypothetical protein
MEPKSNPVVQADHDNRRAPMQGDSDRKRPINAPGSISWAEHLEIYAVYASRYGRSQSPERLAERGGFGYNEVVYLTGAPPKTYIPNRPHHKGRTT